MGGMDGNRETQARRNIQKQIKKAWTVYQAKCKAEKKKNWKHYLTG